MQVINSTHEPPTDVEQVVKEEIRFGVAPIRTYRRSLIPSFILDIYFLQRNAAQHAAALALRDAVLNLRYNGAFVAVPLHRVNSAPIGPHPVGSYEIWVPSESFASVYSYLCQHRGDLSILIHPLTREEVSF
ncbi:unnamed protein product [Rhizoctonia solani]|uniref:Uncharacterized protein n=1 Tax=Rhizoctonia solani TaxID=456999 RepID=A0A8H3DXJ6_9AGAM|nr:unnamed protein product [Rhizoctonia solani]